MRRVANAGRHLVPLLPYRTGHFALSVILASLAAFTGPLAATQAESNRQASTGTFLPSNRVDSRGIQRARELIAKGEYSQSIRFLDEILSRSEDSFVASSQGEFAGLKETARQMLKQLPSDGSRIYEATFGPVARRLLKQSAANGDVQMLREIAQRYFYTPAGHEAALLYAQSESDQGRHLTAALTYDQLLATPSAARRFEPQLSILAATSWLAANNPDRAAEILQTLSLSGVDNVQVAGSEEPVKQSQHGMVEWLLDAVGVPAVDLLEKQRQWLTSRGNASRNGRTDGGLPHLRVRWKVRLLEHQNLERVHDEMEGLLSRQRKSRLPAAVPLAVGDYVLVRSVHGLVAVDFRTGKRIWRSQPERDSMLQNLMDGSKPQNDSDLQPAQSFAQTVWEDFLFGSTSSDGKRVYVIRDLAPAALDRSQIMPFWQQPNTEDINRVTNRLCAYDLATQGKLIWEIDGAVRNDQLKGAFFLGAPVTVGKSICCLVEIKSDTAIYLVALDRQTGELQWRQQLVDLERGIDLDVKRRLQASMPSYAEGMLVCPTGAGVVVGVDLSKQALAWAYRYPNQKQLSPHQRRMQQRSGVAEQHWVHSAPIIAEGKILLSPIDSDELHCLDLLSGKRIWKKPRDKALYLAGIDQGNLLLVSNEQIAALKLSDGSSAWDSGPRNFPGGSNPTGTGFFDDGQYYLPLSNAHVVAVDVNTGELTAEAKSRDGVILGNLICYRGSVISQSGRYLDCFDQIDVLRAESERRRAADPNDFEALRTLGEIEYNEGRLNESLDLLIQAYEQSPHDLRTREVLAEALVSALDEDFEHHRERLPLLAEIEEQTSEAQLTLMRLQAQGLQTLGEPDEAFTVCLNAYREMASSDIQMTIGLDRVVSSQRWLRQQVHRAWTTASDVQRASMATAIKPMLKEVTSSLVLDQKKEFYDSFQSTGLTDELGLDVAQDYLELGEFLRGQQLLLQLMESEGSATRAAATALLSKLLHQASTPFLAAQYDHILRTELSDEVCLDGKTGAECLAEWSSESERDTNTWPYGRVEITVQETKTPRGTSASRIPNTGIPLERCDEILGSCNVTLAGMVSGRNRALTIQDSRGRNFYTAKIDQNARSMVNSQAGMYGVSRGNLLILSLGHQIVAFDTFSKSSVPLWRKETTSSLNYLNQSRAAINSRLGRHRAMLSQKNSNWLGVIGPVTQDSCIFQIDEQLVCVDSFTGKTKWSRDHLPLGCDLYGDEYVVFAVPKNSDRAYVYSAQDGKSLGETASIVPNWQQRLATHGREMIRWSRNTENRTWQLSALDTLSGEESWSHQFERNSRADIAQSRFVVVAEPSGHCTVIDIASGNTLVDAPVKENFNMNQVHLLVSRDEFLVAIQQPLKVDQKLRYVSGFNSSDFTKPYAGQVYLFDRQTGESLWGRPAEIQGLPMMLNQGVDLPMITFAGNIMRRDKQGSKREIGLMMLEKSTGRLLFHEENLPQSAHYCSVRASEREPNTAIVEMINRRIELKFTDQARAPEPPAMSKVQRNVDEGSKGLKKIGQSLIEGL